MDRLQMALEKARAQRQRAPGGAVGAVPRTKARRQVSGDASAAWEALTPISINKSMLVKNRLISFEGGSGSAPFDMLRTKMLQQIRKNGWRRVAIVSPHSACGKSTTAANLGFSLGRQKELRTMVLDFDLRRMGLAKLLSQRCKNSMADVLERRIPFEALALRHGDNVAFALNCVTSKNPSEILQSHQTVEVLQEIEDTYYPDVVLFDMPPMMASDDTHGFLKNVDCALLIVAAEQTSIDEIDVAERQLAELTNVLGIVLNKCRYATGAYGYEYGYD